MTTHLNTFSNHLWTHLYRRAGRTTIKTLCGRRVRLNLASDGSAPVTCSECRRIFDARKKVLSDAGVGFQIPKFEKQAFGGVGA